MLLGKLAKLVSGVRDVSDVGGVSSLLPGSDLTGVLEKCSRLDRTSVCCNKNNDTFLNNKNCLRQLPGLPDAITVVGAQP